MEMERRERKQRKEKRKEMDMANNLHRRKKEEVERIINSGAIRLNTVTVELRRFGLGVFVIVIRE